MLRRLQEKFLTARIKVNNKAGNLGESVKVAREGNKVTVSTNIAFAKRYLKVRSPSEPSQRCAPWRSSFESCPSPASPCLFVSRVSSGCTCRAAAPSRPFPRARVPVQYLTKKYLKKNQLRDYLRVVAPTKNAYELRYYKMEEAADEE
jgi:hypothetical protein